VITVRHLGKQFGAHRAVDDLSFDVRPGVVTGFLGPNGAGKSTTLRLMLDLDRGEGSTRFDDRRYRDMDNPLGEVGAVLDARSFHPTRTARNHLRMLAAAGRLPAARVPEVLDLVGLTGVAGGRPRGFSLGMAQRLSLAAALLGDPHTLLLDEPANGLDPHGIQWLRAFLQDFAAQGRTVLVSSHLLAEMALMAEDLVVIGRGRLISSGSVHDFVQRFTHEQVRVRSPQRERFGSVLRSIPGATVNDTGQALLIEGVPSERIGDRAAEHGIVLHELSIQRASLEEAFLNATGGAVEYGSAGPPSSGLVPADTAGARL
jgi:ABC-2 type transport system ATP-binding protein